MSSMLHEKQAKLIVNYSVEVGKGDKVIIRGDSPAEPLIREIFKLSYLYYRYAQDHQLDYSPEYRKHLYETADCDIAIIAYPNPRYLSNIPPEKISRRRAALIELGTIHDKRAAAGELRWNLSPFASTGLAQEAGMSRLEYEELIYKALLLDKPNPVEEWKAVSAKQARWVEYLNKLEELHITGEDIDLRLSVAGRRWENCNGKRNLPDGEIFSAPVEDSVTGYIRFNFPGIYQGNEIEDIRLKFEKGKIVEAKALKGENFLQAIIKTDPGAERLGEIGIGTNFGIAKLTREMLFDEKMGGTIHLALGSGYPEVGALNKSGIHWDLLAKPSEIYGDGELFWKDGKFVIT
ncbi:MAG: aminopeptidase [Candidatus Hodarchaeales archaeon]